MGGEPAIVALWEAVKNSRQSDTILENSPKGDSLSSGAAENAVREAEGMTRTWKMSVEDKLKAVLHNKHVLFPWLVMHAGFVITGYKTVHDGETACQRTKQHDATVQREGRLDDAQGHLLKEQIGHDSSIRSVRRYRAKNRRVFVVLTPEGAVAVRTVQRLSEDRKWSIEFMSSVKGAPWDFKANVGDDIIDGGIPGRVDARPPDQPIEIPPLVNARRIHIRRKVRPDQRVSRPSERHVGNCALVHISILSDRMEKLRCKIPEAAVGFAPLSSLETTVKDEKLAHPAPQSKLIGKRQASSPALARDRTVATY